ncbi:MAG: helix-turn-helix transcriptional regulator [Fibrobacteraceae bacterium]|nr:helix-turn-helix transcriptional regulator [Fibrobacteraceae bacterium]
MNDGFNKRLQQAISRSGMTQKEVAVNAGVTEAAVSHYIKGDRVPRFVVAIKLAEVLGVSVEELIGCSTEPNFDDVYKIVARSARQLNDEQKFKLVKVLLKDGKI